MANRRFQRLQALEKEVKKLHLRISTDGSGDVSSFKGVGIASVSHSSNVYTITLQDRYNELLHVSGISSVAASYAIDSESVASSSKEIQLSSSAAQASTTLRIEITLKNSSVEK